jgi:6-pyruvoyltetrahydropterin/6-carboxytetrahydropterin synthase
MKIKTEVNFESAHRQYGDKSKCGKLHGHNWKAIIEIESNTTNGLGFIVDFKDIKAIFEPIDHAVILNDADPLLDILQKLNQKTYGLDGVNPTCEELARHIYDMLYCLLDNSSVNALTISITLYENEVSSATFTGE